jgi:hypothetical protein
LISAKIRSAVRIPALRLSRWLIHKNIPASETINTTINVVIAM